MILDEFQKVIRIHDVCYINDVHNHVKLSAKYLGCWECEEGVDILHFKSEYGVFFFKIPLSSVKSVAYRSIYFHDYKSK